MFIAGITYNAIHPCDSREPDHSTPVLPFASCCQRGEAALPVKQRRGRPSMCAIHSIVR